MSYPTELSSPEPQGGQTVSCGITQMPYSSLSNYKFTAVGLSFWGKYQSDKQRVNVAMM